jgi:hypothetical protein
MGVCGSRTRLEWQARNARPADALEKQNKKKRAATSREKKLV